MRKTDWLLGLSLVNCLSFNILQATPAESKLQHGHGLRHKMGGQMMGGQINIPDKLPAPKNAEWVRKLQEVLVLEKKSYAQYMADSAKYNASLPYTIIVPQEEHHIKLIEKLLSAYDIKITANRETAQNTENLKEAMELCIEMEKELISRYTWLIANAEDKDSAIVLNRLLFQTRWHLMMFEHSISTGGHGLGPGMRRFHSGHID